MSFPPARLGKSCLSRHHLNGSAERVAPVLRTRWPEQRLDAIGLHRLDKSQVLIRSGSKRRIVEPNPVNEVEYLVTGEAA